MAHMNVDPAEQVFLDKQTINLKQNGESRYVAALHKGWASNRSFMRYFPYPVATEENEDFSGCVEIETISTKEIWKETAQFFIEDLEFLLSLPYHKFWSQVVYHYEVRESLTSYLAHAPRCFNKHLNCNFPNEISILQAQINRLVFMVYLRISTHKESNNCRITPSVFGNLIYDNYLFDIPIIYDLCAIYGDGNKELLKKMIENIFQNQQSYLLDLKISIDLIITSITTIDERFGLKYIAIDNSESISNVKSVDLQETILYTLDTFGTIFYFMDIYPSSCSTFFKSNFTQKMVSLYDSIVGFVLPELRKRRGDLYLNINVLKLQLEATRTCILKIFRLMIETCCLQPLLEQESEKTEIIDSFLNTISNILSDKRFAKDYELFHTFSDDLDMFIQAGVTYDLERVNYIIEGIQVIMNEVTVVKSSQKYEKEEKLNGFLPIQKKLETPQEDKNSLSQVNCEYSGAAAASPQITGIKLDSLISQVKDLLNDLGDGFVQMCLDYYNYDVEKVINAILEDNLPQSLSDLDRKMNKLEDVVQPQAEEFKETTLLSQRKNVYDNDEFDVFNRNDVDMAKVHKGKRKTTEIVKDEKVKAVTLQLLEDYSNENSFINVYDDEYDDTYDEQAIAANESLTFDELLERRPFEVPRVLGGRSLQRESSDEYEEEIPENKNRDEFVQNPAELRAKAEQRRQDSRTYRPPSRDVKGVAKGQGQSDNVVRNRSSKEKNKSYVGNHNRRALADRKRKI